MASSSSPDPSTFTISQELFNAFHNIDRQLYACLVGEFGRDPAESMQVMALWLWLERTSQDQTLVQRILNIPAALIYALADEAVMILSCIERDEFVYSQEDLNSGYDIPLTQNMVKMEVSVPYFHARRLNVIRGVSQVVNEVCIRAFQDIMQNVVQSRYNYIMGMHSHDGASSSRGNLPNEPVHNVPLMFGTVPFYGVPYYGVSPRIGLVPPTMVQPVFGTVDPRLMMREPTVDPRVVMPEGTIDPRAVMPEETIDPRDAMPENSPAPVMFQATNPYDLGVQREVLSNELSELLSHINLSCTGQDVQRDDNNNQQQAEQEVPPDDRTVFLTFSKGYPISENEVRDFFTRKYGDCIVAIYMQEVHPDEQVLFARLVVRSESVIDAVLEGQIKAKFAINGKHVWARKYVRKPNPKYAGQASSSS